jgi:DNA-directed RNA polymerase specialized sigma24 family protein
LRYVDDLAVRDVARMMRRTEGSVESLLSRAKVSLRDTLTKDE